MAKIQMPEGLAQALATIDLGAIITEVNQQAAVIAKMSRQDAESCRGAPVRYWFEAGYYSEGAIIAMVLEIHDRPDSHIFLDTFVNPANSFDRNLIVKMAGQMTFDLIFFDERLEYVYSKRLRFRPESRQSLSALIDRALDHNSALAEIDTKVFEVIRQKYMADRPRG